MCYQQCFELLYGFLCSVVCWTGTQAVAQRHSRLVATQLVWVAAVSRNSVSGFAGVAFALRLTSAIVLYAKASRPAAPLVAPPAERLVEASFEFSSPAPVPQ